MPQLALVFLAAIIATGILRVVPATANHIPAATNCQNDVDGANDEPGQKDVTRFCVDTGTSPFELFTLANWDELQLAGANTADVCTVYDTDADGNVDLAVCTTLKSSGPGNGNLAILDQVRLFTCNDTRADRCAGSSLVAGPYATECEVTQEATDPFSPAVPNGPGDEYPDDTQIVCAVDLDDFGLGGSITLLDACAYPSTQPGSDPSDCILFIACTTNAECDDGNSCTTDLCDTGSGACDHTPNTGQSCSDGLFCNGDEVCSDLGFCPPSVTPRDCDDGVDCTIDDCDEFTDSCINEPANSLCNDGEFCNGVETCDTINDCQPGMPVTCSDGVNCTVDSCNENTDTCENTPSDAVCDDGLFCTGTETCDPMSGCQLGTPPNCDDGVDCTVDDCNETSDMCDNMVNDASCDDGQFCNGTETCDSLNDCQPGTAPNCDDAVGCTSDSCNEMTDMCDNVPSDASCSDGEFCTGVEICDQLNDCQPGSDPCPGILCNETTDQCVNCLTDANCDNSVFCDGAETCDVGTGNCDPGMPPNCDDSVGCTTDSCNEATDMCDNVPSDASCSDGDFCTGMETCDPVNDCQAGTPPNCDDGVTCTVDSCNETTDMCNNVPNDSVCDDTLYCNGVEICNPSSDCQAGPPVECADGLNCSTDTCNEAEDRCDSDLSTCICGDGELVPPEECEPPVMAGTFEDCDNMIDDDGDGRVDCRDKDCAPGARSPICDESCVLDEVCEVFIKDPGTIVYRFDGTPDRLKLHGRFPLVGNPDPSVDGFSFQLSNDNGAVYRAFLGLNQLRGSASGRRYKFQDRTASALGNDSASGGLAKVKLLRRTVKGVPFISFRVEAYGDFKAATQVIMSTEMSVGTATGGLTTNWIPIREAWKLPQRNF